MNTRVERKPNTFNPLPKGVKVSHSVYPNGEYTFNETFDHIRTERLKLKEQKP